MRTDFREERKWKLALAYSLAHAVVEWHEAGSAEERIKRGICMSWRRPRPEDVDCDEVVEKVQDLFEPGTGDEDSKGNSTPANDEGSDDDSDEDESVEQVKKQFHLGRFCAKRTRTYHQFTHWEVR